MTAFVVRRARNFGILGLCALILTILYGRIPLHDWKNAAFVTGWLLVVLVLAMALFNARKKLPFLPLFAASQWLQFHVYTGLLAAIVFLVHTGGHLPAGGFDFLLWCGFVLVAISGFVGIGLSRVLPARLRSRGEAVLYERIRNSISAVFAPSSRRRGPASATCSRSGIRFATCFATCGRPSAICRRKGGSSSTKSKCDSSPRIRSTTSTRSTRCFAAGCSFMSR